MKKAYLKPDISVQEFELEGLESICDTAGAFCIITSGSGEKLGTYSNGTGLDKKFKVFDIWPYNC